MSDQLTYEEQRYLIQKKVETSILDRLLHYTLLSNITSILQTGAIYSRSELQKMAIQANMPCAGRLNENYVYTFLTYPYHKKLDYLREKSKEKLVAFSLKRDILWQPHTSFDSTTANPEGLSPRGQLTIYQDFCSFIKPDGFSPINANSEILVYQSIPIESIERLYVKNEELKKTVSCILENLKCELVVIVDYSLFHFIPSVKAG